MMVIVGSLRLCGFFEWTAELVWKHLHPDWFLPAVILTAGILWAFLVNDVVCLVMVPLVLNLTRRMQLPSLPFLLAVATASNIGSVATITGNPQNMLIGSYSGIQYRDFLLHLGPVALAGLFLDWVVLWRIFHGELAGVSAAPGFSAATIQQSNRPPSNLGKPVLVLVSVVLGFFLGAPPALASALGAAALLISRTTDSHKLYGEVDWGLLVFFIGLFLIVGGAENAGIIGQFLKIGEHLNLHSSPRSP
jgi:Na+/H+ antiporter NhaD/arsenite permease-like protein